MVGERTPLHCTAPRTRPAWWRSVAAPLALATAVVPSPCAQVSAVTKDHLRTRRTTARSVISPARSTDRGRGCSGAQARVITYRPMFDGWGARACHRSSDGRSPRPFRRGRCAACATRERGDRRHTAVSFERAREGGPHWTKRSATNPKGSGTYACRAMGGSGIGASFGVVAMEPEVVSLGRWVAV